MWPSIFIFGGGRWTIESLLNNQIMHSLIVDNFGDKIMENLEFIFF